MARVKVLLTTTLILAGIELIAGGCGMGAASRQIQSLSVTPATADAKNFSNGQVQFTAMGTYSQPPSPAPVQAGWLSMEPNIATLSQDGLAQCVSGASGVATIKAMTSGPCSGTGCTAAMISGSAQLTCP